MAMEWDDVVEVSLKICKGEGEAIETIHTLKIPTESDIRGFLRAYEMYYNFHLVRIKGYPDAQTKDPLRELPKRHKWAVMSLFLQHPEVSECFSDIINPPDEAEKLDTD